jgi:hypothetical protein
MRAYDQLCEEVCFCHRVFISGLGLVALLMLSDSSIIISCLRLIFSIHVHFITNQDQ